jgi:ribonucleoside-diphosphate reductase alpha chain
MYNNSLKLKNKKEQKQLILYEGYDVQFDYSKLRDSGARLKTMGGKSAGPDPLKQLLNFTKEKVLSRQGKRLQTIDLHDIICKIGEVVVMGGVRRSSLISLSDLDDLKMRNAKIGAFWIQEPQRQTANNSSVYTEKPDALVFIEEMLSLAKSRSGERGIFNRGSLNNQLPTRRLKLTNGKIDHYGTNPCGEILLRSKQFCNLSEVIARREDTLKTLMKKIEIATILGTYQATLTDFPFLSEEWKENCEKERLLGVSITGQYDCPILFNDDGTILNGLKNCAIEVNKLYSELFNINQSTAITCVKPSGTVSQLTNTSSGLHLRYGSYYIRRIRISNTDALFKMLNEQGVPFKPEVGQDKENAITFVLEFPVKSPALDQLNYWFKVKLNYTEHNPSATITVKDNEWIDVINWLYNHWHNLGGLSFMPADNHIYQLAPYEEITKDKYNELISTFPKIDFSQIVLYEDKNNINMTGEMACTANGCEII